MDEKKPPASTIPPQKRRLLLKKIIGVFVGAVVGAHLGFLNGPSNKVWRPDLILQAWQLNHETVSCFILSGILIGGTLAGGAVGLVGWSLIVGMLSGIIIGEGAPYQDRYPWAFAGTGVGLFVGVILEFWRSLRCTPKRKGIAPRT